MLPLSPIPLALIIITLLCGLFVFGLITAIKSRLQPQFTESLQHWRDTTKTTGQMLARLYRAFIVIGIACVVLGLVTCVQFHMMAETQERYLQALQSRTLEQAQISQTNASPYDCVGRGEERRCVMALTLSHANGHIIKQDFYLAPGIRLSKDQIVTLAKTAQGDYVLIDPEPLLINDKVIEHYSVLIYLGLLLTAIGWAIRWGRDTLLR